MPSHKLQCAALASNARLLNDGGFCGVDAPSCARPVWGLEHVSLSLHCDNGAEACAQLCLRLLSYLDSAAGPRPHPSQGAAAAGGAEASVAAEGVAGVAAAAEPAPPPSPQELLGASLQCSMLVSSLVTRLATGGYVAALAATALKGPGGCL